MRSIQVVDTRKLTPITKSTDLVVIHQVSPALEKELQVFPKVILLGVGVKLSESISKFYLSHKINSEYTLLLHKKKNKHISPYDLEKNSLNEIIDTLTVFLNFKNEKDAQSLIAAQELNDHGKLISFLQNNPLNLHKNELALIAELANNQRDVNSAFYTRPDICFSLVKNLPDFEKEEISVLEPSVGVGNFIPYIIHRYPDKKLKITVCEINPASIEVLNILYAQEIKDLGIEILPGDFLLNENLKGRHFDLTVGNPPFGNVVDKKPLQVIRKTYPEVNNNLFSLFLVKCMELSNTIALIGPKGIIAAPAFDYIRSRMGEYTLLSIADYGKEGFVGVAIETVAVVLTNQQAKGTTKVSSYITNENKVVEQSYIQDERFPLWLIYRDEFFDGVVNQMNLGVFDVFRDRQISKKNISSDSSLTKIIKGKEIQPGLQVIHLYDTYIDRNLKFKVFEYMDRADVYIAPNLTAQTRIAKLPDQMIVDGSCGVLILKPGVSLSNEDLLYFQSDEFKKFYRIVSNYGERTVNLDKHTILFWGQKRPS